jgi:hypothetical protein
VSVVRTAFLPGPELLLHRLSSLLNLNAAGSQYDYCGPRPWKFTRGSVR